MIRRLKLSYMLYNLFHRKQLQHNIPLFKKWGVQKKYYSHISSLDFEHINQQQIELNLPTTKVSDSSLFNSLSPSTQQSIQDFDKNGFCLLQQYADTATVNKINDTIEELHTSGKLPFKYGNRLMFAIHQSDYLESIWTDNDLVELLSHLIKGDAKLFQSINFLKGSQQKTHSDSIHMTTFPLGGLLGVWLALEDIELDNGPLHYYPKSHKLPYYLNKDYDNIGTRFFLGNKGYVAYEKMLGEKIKEQQIKKEVFTAKKGDLFIWHANLMHGGEPHLNKNKTRKSMVLHYFDTNRICYHEITQRPALMHKGI